MSIIGNKVKKIRENLGMTQKKFADHIGVSDAHISKIEKGKDFPSRSLIQVICSNFRVAEYWLVDDNKTGFPIFLRDNTLKERLEDVLECDDLDTEMIPNGLNISEIDWYFLCDGKFPNIDVCIKVCDFFDVSLDWFVRGIEHGAVYSGDLTIEEANLLSNYRKLDDEDKTLITQLSTKLEKRK